MVVAWVLWESRRGYWHVFWSEAFVMLTVYQWEGIQYGWGADDDGSCQKGKCQAVCIGSVRGEKETVGGETGKKWVIINFIHKSNGFLIRSLLLHCWRICWIHNESDDPVSGQKRFFRHSLIPLPPDDSKEGTSHKRQCKLKSEKVEMDHLLFNIKRLYNNPVA